MMNVTIREERISAEEYIDFLKRTDLGSQYPEERFEERIRKLVRTVSISLVARNENGTAIGVLFGLTDFAYWLYITDLGTDEGRAYDRGRGKRYRGLPDRERKRRSVLREAGHEKSGRRYAVQPY